jgi:alpha-L-rhamnosidase
MIIRIALIFLLVGTLHLYGWCGGLDGKESSTGEILQRSMIWLKSAKPGEQAYVVFRKELTLNASIGNAELQIFADTRYMLSINGQYVERGPCRFDPKHPEYDNINVSRFLLKGRNTIAILVHHYAISRFKLWHDKNSRMMDHEPGLTALLTVNYDDGKSEIFKTDETWKASSNTRFRPSPGSYSSVPDRIDARLDVSDWSTNTFKDSDWENASNTDGTKWGNLTPRSIPLLKETIVTPLKHERLPRKMAKGDVFIVDAGKLVQAYSILEFNASEGSKIELRHYSFKGVSASFTQTMFDSYIARSGIQRYISGDTYGFRYLEIKCTEGSLSLNNIQTIQRKYPYERLGSFSCSDTLLNKLWKTSVNTVEACSEDALVDCADRERAQWMADGYKMNYPVSRVSLATRSENGTYQYADSRLLKNMLRHVALSQLKDGRVQPMRPSDYKTEERHGVIDDYSCLFIQALREYYDRTSDRVFLEEMMPSANQAMDYFLKRTTDNGLINAGEFVYFDNPMINVKCEGATINAFIYGSLRDLAYLSGKMGKTDQENQYQNAANKLYTNYNRLLWNGEFYYSSILKTSSILPEDSPPSFTEPYKGAVINGQFSPPTPHAALMALYYDLVPAERKSKIISYLQKSSAEKQVWWPYTSKYYLEVLFRENKPELDQLALDYIRNSFGHMCNYETGTTSEDWKGGSFVHESGSHPAWFMSAWVLGVRTETIEGKLRLIIQPRLGNLNKAEGRVLSEFGEVSVKWQKLSKNKLSFDFSIPKGGKAMVYLPVQSTIIPSYLTINGFRYIDNGKTVGEGKLEGSYYQVDLAGGQYSGEISY